MSFVKPATPDYSYSQNHIQIANVDFIDDACDDEGIGDIHNPKWRVFMPKSRRRWRVYQEKEMNDLLDRCEIQQPKVMNGTDGVEYTIVKSSDNEGIIHYTEDLPIKKLSVCPDNQNEYKRQQQEQEPDEKSESADDESIQQWQWFDKENRRWCVSPDISEDMSKLGVSQYCGGLMKTSEDTGTLYREATSITYKLRRVDPLNTRYPDSFEREYTAQKTLHLYRNKSIMKEFYEARYLEDLKTKMNPKELQIINVYCNNNISCFDEFYAQKRCMEARMGPINEERLFRACFEKDRVFIQNNAFGNRYDDYGDIGRGLYFHTTPLRAIHFKAKTQWQSSQLVLIECIVLLGDCHDHIANNRWPNNRNGICYDSKRNGDGDCYVIRKKERAYPLYFIHYNTADAAQHPYY